MEPTDAEHARDTIDALGLTWDPGFGAVAQLGAAIRAVQGAGLRWDAELAALYLEPIRTLAAGEIAPLADMAPADAVAHAVLAPPSTNPSSSPSGDSHTSSSSPNGRHSHPRDAV